MPVGSSSNKGPLLCPLPTCANTERSHTAQGSKVPFSGVVTDGTKQLKVPCTLLSEYLFFPYLNPFGHLNADIKAYNDATAWAWMASLESTVPLSPQYWKMVPLQQGHPSATQSPPPTSPAENPPGWCYPLILIVTPKAFGGHFHHLIHKAGGS